MTIYLRSIEDEGGDLIGLEWFCCYGCYATSLEADPTGDQGGAFPCGMESDCPDACATCGDPVGNPLTSEGDDYARELMATDTDFARALRNAYPELVP